MFTLDRSMYIDRPLNGRVALLFIYRGRLRTIEYHEMVGEEDNNSSKRFMTEVK